MKSRILKVLLAGVALLAACKGKTHQSANLLDTVSANTVDTTQNKPKIVKTAEIGFKVKNVETSSEKIASLTTEYGGTIVHHQTNSTIDRSNDVHVSDDSIMRVSALNTSCEITARVPSEKLEEYMDKISRLGIYVNLRKMDMEDKSLDYLSSQLKLNSKKGFIDQQKNGKVIVKDPSAVLQSKDDIVNEQISNRKIDNAVKYSVVNLNFYQSNTIIKEIVANDDPSTYSIGFFKRVGLAFGNGWYIFKEVLLLLINIWVFLLAGAIVWIVLKTYRKKGLLKTNI